MRRDVT